MMTPRPEPYDSPKSPDRSERTNSDIESGSDDWEIGYAVDMNGVYRSGGYNANELTHDDEFGSGDEISAELGYAGYEAIRNEIFEDEFEATDLHQEEESHMLSSDVSLPVADEFQKTLEVASSSEEEKLHIPHCPQPIYLDNEKIEKIKTMMSSFVIPPPSWAEGMREDDFKRTCESILKGN